MTYKEPENIRSSISIQKMDKMRCQTSTCTKSSYSGDWCKWDNGCRLTVAEVKLAKTVSQKIHAGRAIQTVKNFRMLSSVINGFEI